MAVAAAQRSKASRLHRINLAVANHQCTRAIDLRVLRRIVHTLLSELLHIGQAELSLCLVAAQEMTRINETFLRHTGSTDVLAFDYAPQPTHGPAPEGNKVSRKRPCSIQERGQGCILCGEIFVCVDEAVTQARRFRTSWQSELVRYAVHGVLHLLGFDDARPAARRKMKRAEDRLLRELTSRFRLTRLATPGRPQPREL